MPLEGSCERHHGDPIGDQLGPVVAQPVLQLAHTVLLLRTVALHVLASPVVTVIALRHGRVVGTILVATVQHRHARKQFRTASAGRGRQAVGTLGAASHGRAVYPVLRRLPRKHAFAALIAPVGLADAMRLGVVVDRGGRVG